ncbi:MAG: LPXTG cell wall anchor domain-containing protein [Oscillospiraceae bacterium]|jgi:LPXTG-motif cell wall-anchored protein|nr:LPXTG cell wall anchor domain-containing protein [Oscillospiraceae bacterium]
MNRILYNIPLTGDDDQKLYIILLCVAVAGIAALTVYLLRRKK